MSRLDLLSPLSGPLPSAMLVSEIAFGANFLLPLLFTDDLVLQGDVDIMAPDALIEEERRLHEEREKERLAGAPSPSSIHGADDATSPPPATAPFAPSNTAPKATARPPPSLNAGRYNALENLLNKSEMYTKFLVEQITNDVEGEALLSPVEPKKAPAPIPASAPEPKTKGVKGANGKKRGRADASTSSLSTLVAGEPAPVEPLTEGPAPTTNPFEATQRILPLLNADLRDYQVKGVK